jgi:hypothetical protein
MTLRARSLAVPAILALALSACGAQSADPPRVPPGAVQALCVNPSSSASWIVRIDESRGTVDGRPARIDERRITWRNPSDGGQYELQRSSGALAVARASSTGGYVLNYRCDGRSTSGSQAR